MNKLIISAAAGAMLLSAAHPFTGAYAASVSQTTLNGMTLSYTVSGTEAVITDCTGTATSFILPEQIDGCTVTAVEANAFADCTSLVSITIPDCITKIGTRAFWNCSALSSVNIGSGISSIGDYAFSACPKLDEFIVDTENTVYSAVEGMLFDKNGSVLVCYAGGSNAVIPQSAVTLNKAAFFGNSAVTSVEIPDSVSVIGDYAFSGCFNLGSVTLPSNVTSLGTGSFMNCTSMKQAVLGEGITSIPQECFSMCTALETVNISSEITDIDTEAFYSCTKLSGIYIPETVTYIGSDALGTLYNVRDGKNIPVNGFYICGVTGSAAESYAVSSGVDFIDHANIPYGDINKDGTVNGVDASAVLSEYARTSTGRPVSFTYYQQLAADFYTDGIVDGVDASFILAEYAKNQTGQ